MSWNLNGEDAMKGQDMEFIEEKINDLVVEVVIVKPTTARSGKNGVSIFFKVAAGPNKGKFISNKYWDDPKCLFVMRRLAIACGFSGIGDDGKEHVSPDFRPEQLKGGFLLIDSKGEEYDGTVRYKATNERKLEG